MNRLHILARSLEDGLYYANMTLGLSSAQVNILKNIKEVEEVPLGVVYSVAPKSIPDEVLEMRKTLMSKSSTELPYHGTTIFEMMERIRNDLNMVNSLYEGLYTYDYTTKGCERVKEVLRGLGFLPQYGYEFDVVRERSKGYFCFIPSSPKMQVIYNLFVAHINKANTVTRI